MNSIYFKEYEIESLYLTNYFIYASESIPLQIYTESIQERFSKIIDVIINYIFGIKKILKIYFLKKNMKTGIKYIEKYIRKYPNLKTEKISVSLYGNDFKDILHDPDKFLQITLNMLQKVKFTNSRNKELYDIMEKYQLKKLGNELYMTTTVENVIEMVKLAILDLNTYEKDIKDNIKEFMYIDKEDGINQNFINNIRTEVKMIADSLIMSSNAMVYDIQSLISTYIKKKRDDCIQKDPNIKNLIKSSEEVKKIDCCGYSFKVLQSKKYSNISCLNNGGFEIYVDNSFFKEPIEIQEAIIFHEIGHFMKGHFKTKPNTDIEDEIALFKRIKHDVYKYKQYTFFSPFRKFLMDNENELLYILLELDADRFAAEKTTKTTIRHSLNTRYRKYMQYIDNDLDKKYNRERMRIRNALL